MGDSGGPEARERLRRALRDYAGRRRIMVTARADADSGAPRSATSASPGETVVRGPAGAPAARYDERGLRALAKEIKALISEDGRRGIRV